MRGETAVAALYNISVERQRSSCMASDVPSSSGNLSAQHPLPCMHLPVRFWSPLHTERARCFVMEASQPSRPHGQLDIRKVLGAGNSIQGRGRKDKKLDRLTVLETVEVLEEVHDAHPLSRRPPPHVTDHGVAVAGGIAPDPSPPHQRLRGQRGSRPQDTTVGPVAAVRRRPPAAVAVAFVVFARPSGTITRPVVRRGGVEGQLALVLGDGALGVCLALGPIKNRATRVESTATFRVAASASGRVGGRLTLQYD